MKVEQSRVKLINLRITSPLDNPMTTPNVNHHTAMQQQKYQCSLSLSLCFGGNPKRHQLGLYISLSSAEAVFSSDSMHLKYQYTVNKFLLHLSIHAQLTLLYLPQLTA